jgi:hypothetical protein
MCENSKSTSSAKSSKDQEPANRRSFHLKTLSESLKKTETEEEELMDSGAAD